MSYTFTAQIIGAKELSEAFKRVPEITKKEFSFAIKDAMDDLANKAGDIAPYRRGQLKGAVRGGKEGPFTSADNVWGKVGTDLEHAKYQEFGTGIYAGRGMITPKRKKVLAWKGEDGRWHIARAVRGIKGKFFYKQAIDYVRPRFTEYMRRALAKIITHLAKD